MKIGKFCEKFGISPTTVRFYIKTGLLVPNKKNAQYDFTASDVSEMKIITQLKKLSFNLDEIKQYLQIIRLYDINDEHIREHLLPLLEMKKESLEQNIETIQSSIATIGNEIRLLQQKQGRSSSTSGIPLDFSPLFACPRCSSLFNLSNLQVKDNRIYSGILQCDCGYSAQIEDGILLVEDGTDYYQSSEFQVLHYREALGSNPDFVFFQYMNDISPEATSLIYKSYRWIDSMIMPYSFKNKIIFIPDLSSHFLYKNLRKPYFKDAFIVVTGFSKENIISIKSHIDLIAPEAKIIYIANTISDLPIQKNSIDLWIDTISSYNFSFFHKCTLHSKIDPYIRSNAKVVGLTKYYERNCKSLRNIAARYPQSMPHQSLLATFKNTMKEFHYTFKQESLIGTALDPGPYYEYHHPGDSHCYYAYLAEKNEL